MLKLQFSKIKNVLCDFESYDRKLSSTYVNIKHCALSFWITLNICKIILSNKYVCSRIFPAMLLPLIQILLIPGQVRLLGSPPQALETWIVVNQGPQQALDVQFDPRALRRIRGKRISGHFIGNLSFHFQLHPKNITALPQIFKMPNDQIILKIIIQ